MKILVLNYEFPPLGGGGGVVCQALCKYFVEHGHHTDVITMGYPGLARREVVDGVHIRRVPAVRKCKETCATHEMFTYVVGALPAVLRALRSGGYDVLHVHFVIPTGVVSYLCSLVSNTPYVLTAHGSDIPGYNPDRFTRQHRITGPLLRRIMGRSAAVTAPSRFLQELIRSNCNGRDTVYLPNGIDAATFREVEKAPRILMTGRLLVRKGFQYVLQAMQNIDADFEIHIAGDGPYRAELERLAAQLRQKVVFHGWLDRSSPILKGLYESSMIYCLPSAKENSSMALLEAMAARMAVVTSNVSGCPETVGAAGFQVSPGDVGELQLVLERLTTQPELCRDYGRKAQARVKALFDWSIIGDQYLQLFAECIAH